MSQYTPQAQHPVSIDDRIKAVTAAREALVGKQGQPTGMMAAFGATSPAKGEVVPAKGEAITGLIRLSEYIAVGHDYYDTHQDTPAADVESAVRNFVINVVSEEASILDKDLRKAVKKAVKRELDKRGY